MEDKNYILNFLNVNGISSDVSDDVIRQTLKSAKWPADEIETALFLIRDKSDGAGIVALTKHDTTLFRSNVDLSSEHLSMLLGVDVVVDPALIRDAKTNTLVKKARVTNTILLWVIILILAILVASFGAWLLMVFMKVGPYQETAIFL